MEKLRLLENILLHLYVLIITNFVYKYYGNYIKKRTYTRFHELSHPPLFYIDRTRTVQNNTVMKNFK